MYPAAADGKAIAAGRLEVTRQWGQRSGVEMCATRHRPAPFFTVLRANLVRVVRRPTGCRFNGAIALTGSRSSKAGSSPAAQPRLGQEDHDLPRRHRLGTFSQCGAIAFGDDVVMITLERASWQADPGSEVVQLLVGLIADQMRPEVTMAWPYRRVDIDGHMLPSGAV